MKLSRKQLRKLIVEELDSANSQRRQLNEMTGMEMLAAAPGVMIGLALFATTGIFVLGEIGKDIDDFMNQTGAFAPKPESEVTKDLVNQAQTNSNLKNAAEEVGERVQRGEDGEQAVRDVLARDSKAAEAVRSAFTSSSRGGIPRHASGFPEDPEDDDFYERKYRGGIFGGMGDYRDM